MKVTTEDLRRHYDSLSDSALLEIQKSDLTDVARACYEEECARRGLTGGASAAKGSPASAEDVAPAPGVRPLVTIAEGLSFEEARYARELLSAAGIPSDIGNANPGGSFSYSVGDLFVQVPEDLAEQAREALETELSEEELAAQAEAAALESGEGEEGNPGEPPPASAG